LPSFVVLTILGLLVPAALVFFVVYLVVRYAPIVGRVFEEMPLLLPLRVPPEPGGQDVRFPTRDGLELAGSYFPANTETRTGVVVFCHEFLGDRHSFLPYAGALRDDGFDVFTFDFRNHGGSQSEPGYRPMQWVSNREVRDLLAALAYLRKRPDADSAGFGLFGISKGGSTALCVAGKDPSVWGVATDGAFPIRGTMTSYIRRWAQIYTKGQFYEPYLPGWIFAFVAWAGRVRTQYRRDCRFPDVERAVAKLGPRPWLMIHGEKDAYIGPEIARTLFAEAKGPKDLWIVPKAKHNRCREAMPEAYRERLRDFFRRSGPRRPSVVVEPPAASQAIEPLPVPLASPIATPIPH